MGIRVWNWLEHVGRMIAQRLLGLTGRKITDGQWAAFMQFVKFTLVGLSNTVLTYLVYAVCIYIDLYYQLGNVIGYVAGILNSFYWNNKYVFKEQKGEERSALKALAKCFASYGVSYVVSAALLFVWVDMLGISEYFGPLITIIVTTPLNFIMNKLWAFKTKETVED